MKYLQILDDQNAVIWQDEDGNSGVINQAAPEWEAYLKWCADGNNPESMTPADTRSIEDLRIGALQAINASADSTLAPITSQYPRAEIDSWPEQCAESRSWLASSSVHTPLLDAIAGDLDDASKEHLCLNILGKADAYKAAVGAVIAWRRTLTTWVEEQAGREQLISFEPQFPEVPHG